MRMLPKIYFRLVLNILLFVSRVTYAKDVKNSRRILEGDFVDHGFNFMVYLTTSSDPNLPHNWLCGGVIIHEEFILTSGACISNIDYFYVITGTYLFYDVDHQDSDRCVKNTKRRAIWKCLPKEYDDSNSWTANDIAIVKVEKPFLIGYKSPGCWFAPSIVQFNNISKAYERRGSNLWTAGWGSVSHYEALTKDNWNDSPKHSNRLLYANVTVIQNQRCREIWDEELETIIEEFMICTGTPWAPPPDDLEQKGLSPEEKNLLETELSKSQKICQLLGMTCQKLQPRSHINNRTKLQTKHAKNDKHHRVYRNDETAPNDLLKDIKRKTLQENYKVPGICQNDHGGPLLGATADGEPVVVGIISAFIRSNEDRCTEPFLYTSVFYNRQFITCAVHKGLESWRRKYWSNETLAGCTKPAHRSGDMYNEKKISWRLHPDGPSDNERIEDLEIAVKKYLKLSSL